MSDQRTENEYLCCDKRMEHSELKAHLLSDHGLEEKDLRGTRKMVLHLNMDYEHLSTYEWELKSGLKFMQYMTVPKNKLL